MFWISLSHSYFTISLEFSYSFNIFNWLLIRFSLWIPWNHCPSLSISSRKYIYQNEPWSLSLLSLDWLLKRMCWNSFLSSGPTVLWDSRPWIEGLIGLVPAWSWSCVHFLKLNLKPQTCKNPLVSEPSPAAHALKCVGFSVLFFFFQ